VVHLLEPQSKQVESFNPFDSAPGLFLDFANTLTSAESVKAFVDRSGLLWNGDVPESVEDWDIVIRHMRQAVAEWDKAKATGDFKKVVRIIEKRGLNYSERELRRLGERRPDTLYGIPVRILLIKDAHGARLCIRPRHLFHALWIQLTLAIDGSQNFRPCAECRTWFQIESDGNRREYCSDACRMRAYRKRKARGAEKDSG
jgi:hypothetical protein